MLDAWSGIGTELGRCSSDPALNWFAASFYAAVKPASVAFAVSMYLATKADCFLLNRRVIQALPSLFLDSISE